MRKTQNPRLLSRPEQNAPKLKEEAEETIQITAEEIHNARNPFLESFNATIAKLYHDSPMRFVIVEAQPATKEPPAVGSVPADGIVPAGEILPADGRFPAGEILPADGIVPAGEIDPADGSLPAAVDNGDGKGKEDDIDEDDDEDEKEHEAEVVIIKDVPAGKPPADPGLAPLDPHQVL